MNHCIHHVPGRLRVHIPKVKGSPTEGPKLVKNMRSLPGVKSAKINSVTGSALIHYEGELTPGSPLLAFLDLKTAPLSVSSVAWPNSVPKTEAMANKIAQAAAWYMLEKAFERSVPLILAALI